MLGPARPGPQRLRFRALPRRRIQVPLQEATRNVVPVSKPVFAFAQMKNSTVIDDLALIITPHCIGNPAGSDLAHVAREQAIQISLCIRSRNAVLRHRRQIEDCSRVPNREIFHVFAIQCVRTRVTLPLVPCVYCVERLHPRVEWRTQPALLYFLLAARTHQVFSRRISRAALRPAAPLTPPPGCAPAPHKYRPSIGIRYCAAPPTGRTNRNWSRVSSP